MRILHTEEMWRVKDYFEEKGKVLDSLNDPSGQLPGLLIFVGEDLLLISIEQGAEYVLYNENNAEVSGELHSALSQNIIAPDIIYCPACGISAPRQRDEEDEACFLCHNCDLKYFFRKGDSSAEATIRSVRNVD